MIWSMDVIYECILRTSDQLTFLEVWYDRTVWSVDEAAGCD